MHDSTKVLYFDASHRHQIFCHHTLFERHANWLCSGALGYNPCEQLPVIPGLQQGAPQLEPRTPHSERHMLRIALSATREFG